MTAKIVSVVLEEQPPLIPGWASGQNAVIATFDDDTTASLFTYYIDELTFTEAEFVDLTAQEARDLFMKKDLEYLRS